MRNRRDHRPPAAKWNRALQQVQPRYPNMRIYDWPAVAQRSWLLSDGIHYASNGYAHRAVAIAGALAAAFPASWYGRLVRLASTAGGR
ncbi:MAG TPA: hypothetical protein VFO01_17830 [Trebonia sp.]|nr:hypothetical protein [Trebonia sp.]